MSATPSRLELVTRCCRGNRIDETIKLVQKSQIQGIGREGTTWMPLNLIRLKVLDGVPRYSVGCQGAGRPAGYMVRLTTLEADRDIRFWRFIQAELKHRLTSGSTPRTPPTHGAWPKSTIGRGLSARAPYTAIHCMRHIRADNIHLQS